VPIHTTLKLHDDQVIWPERRDLTAVLELKATTMNYIWQTTYQGSTVHLEGTVFMRDWWAGKNRYSTTNGTQAVARWISLDTATSESETAAYTAWTVVDLTPDYRIAVVEMGRKRVTFPELLKLIRDLYDRYEGNGLLRKIIIEDKSSGISALQTLEHAAGELSKVLTGFNPRVDKVTRWSQAAMWCSLDCVLLPHPDESVPWLEVAEEELFAVPNAPFLDQADSFSQAVIYLENYLSDGRQARLEIGQRS
jgi:predicted phage terminase large subunit-like protein